MRIEKDISDHSSQQKAFQYLYDQVKEAHFSGDGILVNHICAVALTKAVELIKKGEFKLSLLDIHWAYTLGLYWLTDEYMLLLMRDFFNPKFILTEANNLPAIVRKLFSLVDKPLSELSGTIDDLKKCNLGIIAYREVFEDSVLLNFIVELLWWRNPRENEWLELLEIWLEQTQGIIKRDLTKLKTRLLVQTQTLFPDSVHKFDPKIKEELDNNIQKLWNTWNSFLDCDWDNLENLLKELVGSSSFEHSLALPLFQLHHSTRIHRSADGSQIIGLTRRRLLIASRKESLCNDIRDMVFYKILADLWQENKPSDATKRFHGFRLAMLNQIVALRGWNLTSWIGGIGQQYEAFRELFRFKGENYITYVAREMIHLAVLSGRFKKEDSLLTDAVQKLDELNEEDRTELIQFLLAMRRYRWPQVLNALSLFSDAIPERLLPSVADWCVKYLRNPIQPFPAKPSDLLAFWANILGYTIITEEICRILHPIAMAAAGSPMSWRSDENGLSQYLLHAPLNLAKEVGQTMFAIQNEDKYFNPYRWSIIFNAGRERKELLGFLLDDLIMTAKEPIQQIQLPSLQTVENKFQAIDDPKFRQWCRNNILTKCNSVIERINPGGGFGGEIFPSVMELVTWPDEEKELIDSLLKAIKAPYVRDHEITLFFNYLAELVHNGPESHAVLVREDFFQWLAEMPEGGSENIGGPLSTIQINAGGYKDKFIALCNLAIAFSIRDETNSAKTVAKWLRENITRAPIGAVAFLSFLISLLGVTDDYLTEIEVVSVFYIVIMRAEQNPQKKTGDYHAIKILLRQIEILIDPVSEDQASLFKVKNKEKLNLFLEVLSTWIPKLSEYNSPEIKSSIARIIRDWKQLSPCPTELDTILKRFQSDARARVRYAALGK